ncbi:MAG: hypothetical protein HRT88_13435 [Lentisphaeraceae bacterium]|nr:hypothetical protein [Lentisphaeraceae bacterium]
MTIPPQALIYPQIARQNCLFEKLPFSEKAFPAAFFYLRNWQPMKTVSSDDHPTRQGPEFSLVVKLSAEIKEQIGLITRAPIKGEKTSSKTC